MKRLPTLVITFATLVLFSPLYALAQGIVPETCQTGICRVCDLFALADNFIDFLLTGIAVPIVVIALVYGGFQLLTAGGSEDKRTQGKNAITNAIIGILIAFFAWAIVNTVILLIVGSEEIGPGAWFEFPGCTAPATPPAATIPPPAATTTPPTQPAPTTPASGIYSHEAAVAALNPGITISSSGGCSDPNNPRCTSLEGIPAFAIDKLNEIHQNCNCSIVITGGTEVGHRSHGQRLPILDLRFRDQNPNLLRGIELTGYTVDVNFGKGATCEPRSSSSSYVPCRSSEAYLIHMEF